MATYKLIQDVEAEDHILGPLTFRQFVFAMIAAFLFYICFFVTSRGAPFLLILVAPPALFFGFFALPFGRDQPTEVWALAKIRFWFKPRKRIWNQSGVKELVTITAPKRPEPVRTNGLSENEVQSRLKALADTIDTRGWATKNVDVNAFATPSVLSPQSDRLLDMSSISQQVQDDSVTAADDILDERNNPIAQQFDTMIMRAEQEHRQQIVNQMNDNTTDDQQAQPAGDYWFMNGSGQAAPSPIPHAAPIDPATEAELASQLRANAASHPAPYGHMHTVQPLNDAPVPAPQAATPPPVTPTPDPAILSLANNDDLNVATLAHEAQRAKDDKGDSANEVEISLH